MSKRWFTPSFESRSSSGPTARIERETNRSKQPSTKKARPVADQRKTTRRCGVGRPADGAAVKDDRVVDVLSKYEPETPNDLVIHVKKVEQVRAWIEGRIANQRAADGKFLLLRGPPGSGKSTTFRVLAKSLNVQIIEWITPLDREQRRDPDDDDDGGGGGNDNNNDDDYDNRRYFRGRSATDLFDSFLWRASRYSCLAGAVVFQQRQQPTDEKQQQPPQPPALKIILVKDFPHSFAQNTRPFHDILRKYRAYDTYPMAFVCNDDALCRNLFPEQIRGECGVHDIAFNAVNCSAVTKALKRLLEMERRLNPALVTVSPNQLCLQTFHQQSAGDLRSALLKFYFSIVEASPSPSLSSSCKAKTEKVAAAAASATTTATTVATTTIATSSGGGKSTCNEIADAGTDYHGLDMFKVIGRILYCKREMLGERIGGGGDDDDDYKFVYDPDQLVISMTDKPCFFAAFLQENYVSRFQDVVNVASAADTFCVADVIFKARHKDTTATSDEMALSCLVRRLMVSNLRPKKSFAPFVKPKTCDGADTFAARFSRSVRSAFPHFQLPAFELVTNVLPFARAIPYLDSQLEPHLQPLSSTATATATAAAVAAFSFASAR